MDELLFPYNDLILDFEGLPETELPINLLYYEQEGTNN